MNILIDPFIKRPVATTLLTAGVVLSGFMAVCVLPVATLPNIMLATVNVKQPAWGKPDTMASSVATPLERQLAQSQGSVDDFELLFWGRPI